jgi:predicted NBD/HSP70 family sugar kinase
VADRTGRGTWRHAKVTKQDSRSANLRATLELVSSHVETSRAEIARQTGLSRPAVSSLVGELIDQNLLRELGQGTSSGGKPPTLLAINDRGRDIVALDLGHQPFQGALVDLTGRIHRRIDAGDPTGAPTGETASEIAMGLIESLIAEATAPVLGIGVGTPGVVDAEGRVVDSANLDWHGLDLGAELMNRFDIPVSIANDAAMAALAEFRRHPAGQNVILIKLGRGVGAGVVLSGELLRGQHSAAGEIGHVRVLDNGEPCRCGNSGCLETVASVPAILRRLDPHRQLPWDAVALSGMFGEEPVRHAISEAGRYLATVLAGVVATIDVSHVVLAAELRNSSDMLVEAVRRELRNRILPSTADLIDIEATQLGADLVLTGAASAVVVDRLGAVLR